MLPRKWFVSKILFVAVSTEGEERKELKLDRWNIWIITAINLSFFVSILVYIPDSLRFSLTYSVYFRTLNVDISIFQSPFLQVFLFTYFLLMQFLVTLRMKQVTNPFLQKISPKFVTSLCQIFILMYFFLHFYVSHVPYVSWTFVCSLAWFALLTLRFLCLLAV